MRLARSGTLTDQDRNDLYVAHVAPAQVTDKVDRLGARVADEIEQVMAMIGAAEGSASTYSADLTDATQRLDTTRDRDDVRSIIEGLVLATKEIEAKNARLQGWAVLENFSGRAWNDVSLTLLSGNPVTFRQALYESYYVPRQVVPVESGRHVLPPPDSGTVAQEPRGRVRRSVSLRR